MSDKKNPGDSDRELSSPYGPQRGHTDESAGGADSSPYETVPSGEKAVAADDPSLAPESGDRKATG